jgi:hypothetical protein
MNMDGENCITIKKTHLFRRLDRDGDTRRRDGGDGDGRLDRDGDGCRPPPPASTSAMLSSPDAVVAAVDADASTSTSREEPPPPCQAAGRHIYASQAYLGIRQSPLQLNRQRPVPTAQRPSL